MGLKRYVADKDTTITNAYKPNLILRGTGSNMGLSDVTEVFEIYGQATTSSVEKSRALYQFPTTTISTDRTAGTIPASGSVNFYLRLFNARHASTTPQSAVYKIAALTRSWDEGDGLSMDAYKDTGYANWEYALTASTGIEGWSTEGGDYYSSSSGSYSVTSSAGEDIEVDITPLVEQWLSSSIFGEISNNGVIVKLSGTFEDGSKKRSYYTKKFFARGTEFFFKKPVIEARWDSSYKDNRGNFYYSSSLVNADNNLNTLFLYNYVNGQLTNIPTLLHSDIYVRLYSGSSDNTTPSTQVLTLPIGGGIAAGSTSDALTYVTGGLYKTGIYTASMAVTSSTANLSTIFDVWVSGSNEYFTGSFTPVKRAAAQTNTPARYVVNLTNLKSAYTQDENPRLRLFVRKRNQNVNVYTTFNQDVQNNIIEDVYYKVQRVYDNFEPVPYGTGSTVNDYTRLSYDVSGSYFDFDMSLLQTGYMYGFKFAFYLAGDYKEQNEIFKFRVE